MHIDHDDDADSDADDDDDLEVEAEDGEGGIVGERGSGSKKKPICQVQPFNPLIMMAMMMLILLEIMMAVVLVTLKTREESPRPMVAMSPPRTDVALKPILWRKVEEKNRRKSGGNSVRKVKRKS